MPNPVITPVKTTPGVEPSEAPWHERYTDPSRICPQQVREGGSPDLEP